MTATPARARTRRSRRAIATAGFPTAPKDLGDVHREYGHTRVGPDDERSLASSLGDEDPALAGVDRNLTLAVVVQRLPAIEQEILRLRFVEGLTQVEIAQRVGRSQMQISRLLARALDRLRGWVTEGPAA